MISLFENPGWGEAVRGLERAIQCVGQLWIGSTDFVVDCNLLPVFGGWAILTHAGNGR